MSIEINKHFRYNFTVNLLDGGFFGSALGFASFVTVLPIFISTITDSAVLIGLPVAIHTVGWQLPQLLTVNRVTQLRRYKPMAVLMTLHERLPFFGLAVAAWLLPFLDQKIALVLIFSLLIWQGLGGGFTATAWQSMIGKIMPAQYRGVFFGLQGAAFNLFGSVTAIIAGILLERLDAPFNFGLCFLIAGILMTISWLFLALTKEPEHVLIEVSHEQRPKLRGSLKVILQRDVNFRWFLVARILLHVATMATGFYSVYAIRYHGMSEATAGLMTSLFMITQIIASPVMGRIGDRLGHRIVMSVGAYAAAASALLAWLAPEVGWFYLVFALAGIANVAAWTMVMAMTLEFGSEAERPAYIGLANTLVGPSAILAPLLGGWLADAISYQATFLIAGLGGLVTALVFQFLIYNPNRAPLQLSGDYL